MAKNLNIANITVELDDSVKENPLFLGIASIEISKMEIFKYGFQRASIKKSMKSGINVEIYIFRGVMTKSTT